MIRSRGGPTSSRSYPTTKLPVMFSVPSILLVEDSPDDLYFFQRKLRKLAVEHHFQHVGDGGAALQVLGKQARDGRLPDLIFLDLKMPVLNGFEVLRWLRDQAFAWVPPVVVLSGSDEEADRIRAAELGVAGYLVKPVSLEDLSQYVQSLGARPRPAAAQV